MRQDFTLEVNVNILLERHVFVVPQVGIGFGVAVLVGANVGGFVPLRERAENRLNQRCGNCQVRSLKTFFSFLVNASRFLATGSPS